MLSQRGLSGTYSIAKSERSVFGIQDSFWHTPDSGVVSKVADDVSDESNDVTNNSILGMLLHMCLHDNSVDTSIPDFQSYIALSMDPNTKMWIREWLYRKTSGAVFLCLSVPMEKYHPNQNYGQNTSSVFRVLTTIQTSLKNITRILSYADLFHDGCIAAGNNLLIKSKPRNIPCHADTTGKKNYPLCGLSELLPGDTLISNEVIIFEACQNVYLWVLCGRKLQ
jgi:hypothetical protein